MSNFSAKDLKGCMTALVTPMKKSSDIDYQQWQALIKVQIKSEITAIVVAGTTGESAVLNPSEFYKLLKIAVKLCQNTQTKVIAQTGNISADSVIQSNEIAYELGADAVLVVTPYYLRTTQKGLYAHFLKVSRSSKLPIILYNVPSRTHNDLLPQTTAKLAIFDNIIGLKEAASDERRIVDLLKIIPKDFSVVSGSDDVFLKAMSQGAKGVISVASNVRPKTIVEICRLMLSGDEKGAKTLNSDLQNLYSVLSCQPNPIPVKYLLSIAGIIGDGIRLPLVWFDGKIKDQQTETDKIKKEYLL